MSCKHHKIEDKVTQRIYSAVLPTIKNSKSNELIENNGMETCSVLNNTEAMKRTREQKAPRLDILRQKKLKTPDINNELRAQITKINAFLHQTKLLL
ncbi:MAG: hypothetical protein LBF70_02405 [Holosporales bacterium]|jgi:hypothetical protein|nr:hypothetical protein [Holosporales bacterium]